MHLRQLLSRINIEPPTRRGRRYRYRYNLEMAAQETFLPRVWLWYWVANGQLRRQYHLRQTWVRLEHVQWLAKDIVAVAEAYLSTKDYLCEQELREVYCRWPELRPESEPERADEAVSGQYLDDAANSIT